MTAAGEELPILDQVTVCVKLNNVDHVHDFLVVAKLKTSAILGINFLQQQGLLLNFRTTPVTVLSPTLANAMKSEVSHEEDEVLLKSLLANSHKGREKTWSVTGVDEDDDVTNDMVEECAIPIFSDLAVIEPPQYIQQYFEAVVKEFGDLFSTQTGRTNMASHHINTTGLPVRVPARRIPVHFREEIKKQIKYMLEKGVIEESCSPWTAPAVYVRKKTGEIRLCVDYRALNKQTQKDAYPLPLIDEVQDRLTGSAIFSKLDLQSGYWQVPVDAEDQAKTAFSPGPGMGLFQFRRMPFGLCGAPSTFQRLMNTVMRGLPFVTTYIDDVLIHSPNEEAHKQHLTEAFKRLRQSGLTLRGSKCQIGVTQVSYLGHIFSAAGMAPDSSIVQAVQNWPRPNDVTAVKQFLGLASYYRRYIMNFADIARPLHV